MPAPRTVVVLAKQPVAGAVKTRLCPPLSPQQAARFAAAAARDTLEGLVRIGGLDVRLALDRPGAGSAPAAEAAAGAGAAGEDLVEAAASLGVPVEGQGDGDLGQRMGRVLARALEAGVPAALVGADAPDLPAHLVEEAFASLDRCDAALVPSDDGGYVLVAARRPLPALFAIDAPWGGDGVLDATRRALDAAGCAYHLTAPWHDVDDAAALGRLAARLRVAAPGAPRTARLLEQWKREGVRF